MVPPTQRLQAAYLHFHDGCWAIGDVAGQDDYLWELARGADAAVVSVDYRLAPENPYPAAPDDCEAAAVWLVSWAEEEFDVSRLIIGGESAGAHLAVVTLLRLRDRHRTMPFHAANLVSGIYDLTMTPSQRLWGDRNLILSTPLLSWFYDLFLPPSVDRAQPDVSPLYADLKGLPPALFTIGGLDPLVDDSLFLEARWRTAGSPTQLFVYPESVHGFQSFPIGMGQLARRRMVSWMATVGTAG